MRVFLVPFLVLLTTQVVLADSLTDLKRAYEQAISATQGLSTGFDERWQAARAARFYGAAIVAQRSPGWMDLGRKVAQEGLRQADMATKLEPGRVEGWYWYCRCIQTYTECISLLSAFAEGLQGKSQRALENAYRIDKLYDDGLPILSIGRYWQILPPIAGQDLNKAEAFLEEYVATMVPLGKVAAEGWLFRGELYRDRGKRELARVDFTRAAQMGNLVAAKALKDLK